MDIEDFDQVGMKESDKFRAFANNSRCGSRRVAEQCHLAEEVTGLQLGKRQEMLPLVVEHNVHAAGPDNVDARPRLSFEEDRLSRLERSGVDDTLQNSQFFRCEILKQWDVSEHFRQRFLTCDEPKDVCPNAVSFHSLRIVA